MQVSTASFTNSSEGYRQDFGFTDRGAFTTNVFPLGTRIGAVVICPSLFVDRHQNNRIEVLLSRRLARLGVAVCRFHYRGTGNSSGDVDEITWESVLADAWDAHEQLSQRIDRDAPIGLLGTRFGSLVAVALGAGNARVPIALWVPIPSADTYAHDLERYGRVARITDGSDFGADAMFFRAPADLAARGGTLSIDALADRNLGDVLVARTGRGSPSTADEQALHALRAVAASVEIHDYPDEDAWWARRKLQPAEPQAPMPMIDDTVMWLHRSLTGAPRP